VRGDHVRGDRGPAAGGVVVKASEIGEVVRRRPRRFRHEMATAGGRTQTYEAWAAELGIDIKALFHRLNEGMPLERALTEPKILGSKARLSATVNGVTKTLLEWSAESGIKEGTLRNRLNNGWPQSRLLEPLIPLAERAARGNRTTGGISKHSRAQPDDGLRCVCKSCEASRAIAGPDMELIRRVAAEKGVEVSTRVGQRTAPATAAEAEEFAKRVAKTTQGRILNNASRIAPDAA